MNEAENSIRICLKKAESLALYALQELTPATEYLRSDLEQHLASLQVLLGKMEQEENLLQTRDVLLSSAPENPPQGLNEWISGKTTASDSSD